MRTPATPYLRVDVPRLHRNIDRVAARARERGVALRPHVKTHKTMEVARLQLAAGAVGITVATLGEAETFVRQGVTDVFVAYPLWLDDTSAGRLRDLTPDARVAIGVDSVEGAGHSGLLLGGSAVEVLVEVDSGHHRTGVAPERAGEVALAARRSGLEVRGVFTFPGHSYAPDATRTAADDEASALATAARDLRRVGIDPRVVSGGSTPSLAASLATAPDTGPDTGPEHADVVTELRPGVYVFGDAQQWELGTTTPDRIALTCRATVISHAGDRLVLDAGSKVLGADRAAYATGFGRLPDLPDARVVLLSEHHAVVDLGDAPLPPLGSRVDVVPNHVCAAVNLVDVLHAEESGGLRVWPVTARGLNA
jgi:D-serine deaminase-like pyridoxal phosphate-dependent protein